MMANTAKEEIVYMPNIVQHCLSVRSMPKKMQKNVDLMKCTVSFKFNIQTSSEFIFDNFLPVFTRFVGQCRI